MNKPSKSFLAFAAVVSAVILSAIAVAGPVWKVTLSSTDAGSTQTAAIVSQREYIIQCRLPACFKTGSSVSMSADCTKDYVLDNRWTDGGNNLDYNSFGPFKSGQDTYIVAKALDAGNPSCNVFLDRRY